MGEYVSLDMGCTWKFEASLFSSIFKEYGQVVKTLLGTE